MLDHVDDCIRVTLRECACHVCRDIFDQGNASFLISSLILTHKFYPNFHRLLLTSRQHGVDHAES